MFYILDYAEGPLYLSAGGVNNVGVDAYGNIIGSDIYIGTSYAVTKTTSIGLC